MGEKRLGSHNKANQTVAEADPVIVGKIKPKEDKY